MKKILCLLIAITLLLCSCGREKEDKDIVIGSVNGTEMNLEDYKAVLDDVLNYVYSTYSDGKLSQDEFFKKGKVKDKDAFSFAKDYAFDKLCDIEIAVQMANSQGIIYETLGDEGNDFTKSTSDIQKKILAQDELFKFMTSGTQAPCYVSDGELKAYEKEKPDEFKGEQINYILYRELFMRKKTDKGVKLGYEEIRQKRAMINEAYSNLESGADFKTVWENYSEDTENNFDAFEGNRLYVDSSYGTKADMIKSIKDGEYTKIFDQADRISIFYREKTVMKTDGEIKESIRKNLEESKFSELIKGQKDSAKISKKDKVIKNLEY